MNFAFNTEIWFNKTILTLRYFREIMRIKLVYSYLKEQTLVYFSPNLNSSVYKTSGIIFLLISAIFFASCGKDNALKKIKKTGQITVITRNNAHCFYTYRDTPMGFEYDLAKAFSDYLGVKLNISLPPWGNLTDTLNRGEGDFIAASLTIIPSRENLMDFSEEYLEIQQMAIVHVNNYKIRELNDLENQTLHVRQGTSYEERLKELQKEGLNFTLKTYKDLPTEELIRMVAEKEIEATIADTNVALLNRRYYPEIKLGFPIEEPQSLGWAVRKGEAELLNEINKFIKKIKEDGTFSRIYEKYYANIEVFDYVDLVKYHQRLETRLPNYQTIIQKEADKHGFDWRLIAAMIYQESHFNPKAKSYTGVGGLMQLTLATSADMGVKNRFDPVQSIKGGIKYLKKLYDRFEESKRPDRILIALAAYNVGYGHVRDAQKLAQEKGLNPNTWSSLKETLPLLRYSKYYKKTEHGYCRGTEPVRYVNSILTYYDIIKREAMIYMGSQEYIPFESLL
jgi:membrane-bound lytic murein transglycosylase F